MKRKFILKLTGALAVLGMAVGCLVGCSSQNEITTVNTKYKGFYDDRTTQCISDATEFQFDEYILSDGPIVINEGGQYVMHKGQVRLPKLANKASSGAALLLPILELECGERLQTSDYVAYTSGCPSETKYDCVCECARSLVEENEISIQSEKNR